MDKIAGKLALEFGIELWQVNNVMGLISEGNTIPFIARYRKEATGALSDDILRDFDTRLKYLTNLEDKRDEYARLINEQEKLTDEVAAALSNASTLTELEDIYRPFRPKRRTRAQIAREKGLEPLAEAIMRQTEDDPYTICSVYINEEKGVADADAALGGASDIIAEEISDNARLRKTIRELTLHNAVLVSKAAKDEDSVYRLYYDYSEPVSKIAHHRVLATNRGEAEGYLSIKIDMDEEIVNNYLTNMIIKNPSSPSHTLILSAIYDSYKRLIAPSVANEVRSILKENAETASIKVFRKNLAGLILSPPIRHKTVLGVDPGYRTGSKLAVVDETGKVLDTGVGYFTLPNHDKNKAKALIIKLINKHNVDLVSIGNGTASKESEIFICDILKEIPRKIYYIMTNEAGASVYSASKLAAEEFPDYDVSLRSAVSIARRVQDPLAELVKIDPKSIGVGQYQHDMNQKNLGEALSGVVEDCVNSVGVDLNTASPSLLSYVSGINKTIAKNITVYRDENGRFSKRKELMKVPKLGAKAFEQCAGFLRISDSDNVLDNTSVHPESYNIAKALVLRLGYSMDDVASGNISDISKRLKSEGASKIAEELSAGEPTIIDIADSLLKRGRDPRDELTQPTLRSDVMGIEDLRPGMTFSGTVRNVIDFGAFVDIGVHQDGLVHISQICDRYIKHPTDVLSVGDVVDVKILEVDAEKKRISLTMRQ